MQAHLPLPGLAVVQVAQVENPQDQVAKVEVLVEGLEENGTDSILTNACDRLSNGEKGELLYLSNCHVLTTHISVKLHHGVISWAFLSLLAM